MAFEKHNINYSLQILFLISTILVLISCENQYIRDKETYLVNASNRNWFVDTNRYNNILITDSLGNTEDYVFDIQWNAFNSSKSSSGIFGISGIDYNEYETIHQEFKTSKDEIFHIIITANEFPAGDRLSVRLKDNSFGYDLNKKRLTGIRNSQGQRPDMGYINDKLVELPFESKAIEHDSININGIVYHNALEFILADFEDQWKSTTTISVIIAKEIGLIQYRLNDGNVYTRINR